jgi:hypothetical protein
VHEYVFAVVVCLGYEIVTGLEVSVNVLASGVSAILMVKCFEIRVGMDVFWRLYLERREMTHHFLLSPSKWHWAFSPLAPKIKTGINHITVMEIAVHVVCFVCSLKGE